jgi:hypothetical protein
MNLCKYFLVLIIGCLGFILSGCGDNSNHSSKESSGESYKRLDANLETIPDTKSVAKFYAMKFSNPYLLYSSVISDVKMDYAEAEEFCRELQIGEKTVAWRLPSIGELERLAPHSKPNSYFWSTDAGSNGNNKIFNLKTLDVCNDTDDCRNEYNYVICVTDTELKE